VTTDDDHREFLLAALRAASLRAKLMDAELNVIGLSLKAGMVTPEMAMQWIHDEGLMPIVSVEKVTFTEQAHAREVLPDKGI
jgi:hypothetical protein